MPNELHYIRIPKALGGRAEMVRLCFVLAGTPWVDVLHTMNDAKHAAANNPFKQFPFLVTEKGETIYQTIAIMHEMAHGTPAWPSDPAALTRALSVAMGAYDLYQAFGGFPAGDEVARKKFEERRMPQYFDALAEIYRARPFAAGDTPTFADCIAREAIAWCVRRNEASKHRFETTLALVEFMKRFDELPAIAAFMAKQAAARAIDDAV